jgi:subtilisin family serine protease
MLTVDGSAAERLAASGFEIVDSRRLGLTGSQVLRLRAPSGISRNRALARARDAAPGATIAENDLYRPASQCDPACTPLQLVGWVSSAHGCSVSTRIGMIDTGVDVTHPLLSKAHVTVQSFLGKDYITSGTAHGTAVASMLVGAQANEFQGLLSGATLLAADAFHTTGGGDRADAYSLSIALDWLITERADVINMSLSGPDNDVLERVIAEVTGRGALVVAAAGNDRASTSGYPGRYPGVIAVAGIDQRLRPLARAMRGAHITFAAPATGIAVAMPGGVTGSESGTSFAAPFVTAAYALAIHQGRPRADLATQLADSARDLGAPGRDRIYGHGLVQLGEFASCQ